MNSFFFYNIQATINGSQERTGVGLVFSGDVKRRTMVGRSSDSGKSGGIVDSFSIKPGT